MSKKYYGKRRWVPEKCPDCGTLRINTSRLQHPSDMFWFIKFSGYEIRWDKKQPGFEGVIRWYGRCGNCSINESTEKLINSHAFKFIKKDTNQSHPPDQFQ